MRLVISSQCFNKFKNTLEKKRISKVCHSKNSTAEKWLQNFDLKDASRFGRHVEFDEKKLFKRLLSIEKLVER